MYGKIRRLSFFHKLIEAHTRTVQKGGVCRLEEKWEILTGRQEYIYIYTYSVHETYGAGQTGISYPKTDKLQK